MLSQKKLRNCLIRSIVHLNMCNLNLVTVVKATAFLLILQHDMYILTVLKNVSISFLVAH